ncbi:MAG: hypothetical protein KAQ99_04285 [Candidatus Aureabacteria bacterium]|nr:hypothetical protein [Candidatus Auribacterota bacterium]MCK5160773.1 hypothetical protein [Candidatus Auribacterota bacterium]
MNKRTELNFAKEVISTFDFLTKEYNFRLVGTDCLYVVRYESNLVFINIYHEKISYELGFSIGLLSDKEKRGYTIDELVRLKDLGAEKQPIFFQASTKKDVKHCIQELSKLVKQNGGLALKEDRSVFVHLDRIREDLGSKQQREYELRQVRKEAQEFWKKKTYDRLIELYSSIFDDLTQSEIKKLIYARNQLKKIGLNKL